MDANIPLAPSHDRVSETDLCRWLGAAAPGDQFAYHRGFLAVDRDRIAGRLTERERAELRRVARRVMLAAQSGLADLVQRHNGAGDFTCADRPFAAEAGGGLAPGGPLRRGALMSTRLGDLGCLDHGMMSDAGRSKRIPTSPDVSVAAMELAARGMPVFPCDPKTKRPLVATGFKAATTDGPTITSWWKQWPQAMIGVPTGEASGVFVLDIDRDDAKGLDGFATLDALESKHAPLPATRTQRTPRGGEHRLLSWPGFKIRNSASKLGAGLDIRGDGGYVIVAPSVNADGVPYEWTCESGPSTAPPVAPRPPRRPEAKCWSGCGCGRRQGRGDGTSAAALADACADLARAANGQRNAALNRAAYRLGQLVGSAAIERARAESALAAAATICGLVDDDGEEAVRRTIKSGLDAGAAQLRRIHAAFEPTEDGIARAFAERHKGDLRFCHHAGKWYVWTGTRWQKEETKLAFHCARSAAT